MLLRLIHPRFRWLQNTAYGLFWVFFLPVAWADDEFISTYQQHWLEAQSLQRQQLWSGVLAAYSAAFHALQGQHKPQDLFYAQAYPQYIHRLEALLDEAADTSDAQQKQHLLRHALDKVENLRAAELKNYFQNQRLNISTATLKTFLPEHTAVLYPLLLPQRLELLLIDTHHLHQYSVAVDRAHLTQVINRFQYNLQTRSRWQFISQARQLYDWLISPLLSELEAEQVHTLVMVPDGPLRLIPLAALTDGKQFLVEQLATAITPSLRLTDTQTHPPAALNILLAGLSTEAQGFAALPSVETELRQIQPLFTQHELLLNEDFAWENFTQALESQAYSVVHIASHGRFEPDHRQTFFLTYREKVNMGQLQSVLRDNHQRHGQALELLTLSACQTAVGDEQAALGLAGVAFKAGARSALATLWYINDEATARLLVEFYRQLQGASPLSKAQALQNAQKALLRQSHLRHPVYWAPFLLIGNWL